MNDNIEKKIGRVEISKGVLNQNTGIFNKMNPIHIQQEKFGIYVFTCVSEYFDEIEDGEIIPFYEVTISRVGNHFETSFRRMSEQEFTN